MHIPRCVKQEVKCFTCSRAMGRFIGSCSRLRISWAAIVFFWMFRCCLGTSSTAPLGQWLFRRSVRGADSLGISPAALHDVAWDQGPDGVDGHAIKFKGKASWFAVIRQRPQQALKVTKEFSYWKWAFHIWMTEAKLFYFRIHKHIICTSPNSLVWNFLCVMYNDTSRMLSMYINNTLKISNQHDLGDLGADTTNDIYIGARPNDPRYWRGSMACVTFYNRVLTTNEMRNLNDMCLSGTTVEFAPSMWCTAYQPGCQFALDSQQNTSWISYQNLLGKKFRIEFGRLLTVNSIALTQPYFANEKQILSFAMRFLTPSGPQSMQFTSKVYGDGYVAENFTLDPTTTMEMELTITKTQFYDARYRRNGITDLAYYTMNTDYREVRLARCHSDVPHCRRGFDGNHNTPWNNLNVTLSAWTTNVVLQTEADVCFLRQPEEGWLQDKRLTVVTSHIASEILGTTNWVRIPFAKRESKVSIIVAPTMGTKLNTSAFGEVLCYRNNRQSFTSKEVQIVTATANVLKSSVMDKTTLNPLLTTRNTHPITQGRTDSGTSQSHIVIISVSSVFGGVIVIIAVLVFVWCLIRLRFKHDANADTSYNNLAFSHDVTEETRVYQTIK